MLRFVLILFVLFVSVEQSNAIPLKNDCLQSMISAYIDPVTNTPVVDMSISPDPNHPESDTDDVTWWYDTDSAGVNKFCRTKWPTDGVRLTLTRTTTDQFTAQYRVDYGYCYTRSVGGNGCDTSGILLNWATDSVTFDSDEVKSSLDTTVRKYLVAGAADAYVCLKRYAPGETMRHLQLYEFNDSGPIMGSNGLPPDFFVNNSKKNKICGYTVLPTGDCTEPFLSWQKSWFGCVEEPLASRPVTYNPVIPSEISPVADPRIKLADYVDATGNTVSGYLTLGSKFDQPLIKLINAYSNSPNNQLILRYKFPGDPDVRQLNDYPAFGSFPGKTIVYQAVVDDTNPSQVCACKQGTDCIMRVYVGCVDRPTPYQSNLMVVAAYNEIEDSAANEVPTVSPDFVLTDPGHNIIYYDQDGSEVYTDPITNQKFKRDASGNPTTTPANGTLSYRKLGLPVAHLNIREYYESPVIGSSFTVYARDVAKVYGVQFGAIIPLLDASGNPTYKRLETPNSRMYTDQCNAVKFADFQSDTTKPNYFVPGGARSRTYCTCPTGMTESSCPVPIDDDCKGTSPTIVASDPAALLVYCPGRFTGSEVNTSNKICLEKQTGWNFLTSNDKLCDRIIISCKAEGATERTKANGYSIWPKQQSDTDIEGSCSVAIGMEKEKIYTLSPVLSKSQFWTNWGCTSDSQNVGGNTCLDLYNIYVGQYNTSANLFNSIKTQADGVGRNFSTQEVQSIETSFNGMFPRPTLTMVETAPSRNCNQGFSTVTHPCRKVPYGCVSITEPIKEYGYALWSAPCSTTSTVGWGCFTEVIGSCPAGYIQSIQPKRVCQTAASPIQSYYWTDVTQQFCVPQP